MVEQIEGRIHNTQASRGGTNLELRFGRDASEKLPDGHRAQVRIVVHGATYVGTLGQPSPQYARGPYLHAPIEIDGEPARATDAFRSNGWTHGTRLHFDVTAPGELTLISVTQPTEHESRESTNTREDTMSEKRPLNRILYGPPGTGRTWRTRRMAVELCDAMPDDPDDLDEVFGRLRDAGRIEFVTFHQSFSYEDFVEGIRPRTDDSGNLTFAPSDGIFKRLCERARRTEGRSDIDPVNVTIWKMSLGNTQKAEDAGFFDECRAANELRLGWGGQVDFAGCDTREQVAARFEEVNEDAPDNYAVNVVFRFKNEMQIGDLVVVSDGNHHYRAIGRVAGPYRFEPEYEQRSQVRSVEWLRVLEASQPVGQIYDKVFSQQTLYTLNPDLLNLDTIRELIGTGSSDHDAPACVLIIDEINRANISKVLGELITLIEEDKRQGAPNEIEVTLPYSKKQHFSIPPNLYIVGTMNTADRSIAFLDTALRRRFHFEEVHVDYSIVRELVGELDGVDIAKVLESINRRLEFALDRDHAIGHAWILDVRSLDDVRDAFLRKIIPLVEEFFYGDVDRVAFAFGCPFDESAKTQNPHPLFAREIRGPETLLPSSYSGAGLDLEPRAIQRINSDFAMAEGAALAPFLQGLVAP